MTWKVFECWKIYLFCRENIWILPLLNSRLVHYHFHLKKKSISTLWLDLFSSTNSILLQLQRRVFLPYQILRLGRIFHYPINNVKVPSIFLFATWGQLYIISPFPSNPPLSFFFLRHIAARKADEVLEVAVVCSLVVSCPPFFVLEKFSLVLLKVCTCRHDTHGLSQQTSHQLLCPLLSAPLGTESNLASCQNYGLAFVSVVHSGWHEGNLNTRSSLGEITRMS